MYTHLKKCEFSSSLWVCIMIMMNESLLFPRLFTVPYLTALMMGIKSLSNPFFFPFPLPLVLPLLLFSIPTRRGPHLPLRSPTPQDPP